MDTNNNNALSKKYPLPMTEMVKTVRREYPLFYISLFYEGLSNERIWKDFLGFDYSMPDYAVIEHIYYYPKYHLVDFVERWTDLLFKDKQYFYKIKKDSIDKEKIILKSLNKSFSVFCDSYINYMPTLGAYFVADDIIDKKVRSLLLQASDQKTVDELMPLIATPVKDNFYKKADLYLAKTTNTNLFVKKYGWLKSRYGNIELYSRDEVENILKKLQQENFIQEYNKNKKIIAEAVKKAKKILKIEDRYIIDLMRFFIYYRTQRTDIMNYASYRYANKLEKIAKDKGVSYEDILYCTRKEIESDMINAINIQERKKAWSIVANKNDFQIVTGEDNKKLVDIFSNLEKHGDEIKGKPVFHGVVTGKVRIIKRKDQLSSLAKGDILVTSMTTPDMIPAMKKVAAFVTDEGGITCHAAIIAREMKKPCITGTKNATQVLKDGDLVEVDANKGIVKIIR